jgi:hypothetical protein
MPYIKQVRRKDIDSLYSGLLEIAGGLTHGDLNYIISNLLNRHIEKKEKTYATYNAMIGILECAKMEFYNRLVTPYENIKIVENGSLYKEQKSDLLTLKSEYSKVKNEINSYRLIESLHECDSWEDVFTNNHNTLNSKLDAIEVAIENFIYNNGLQEKVIGIEEEL